jgi:hypothetical protein
MSRLPLLETRIAQSQHQLTAILDRRGCHLDRKMDDLLRAAGFGIDVIATGSIIGPNPWALMYRSSVTR